MFYAILAIIVAAALYLIFRDDHDYSYNRKENPVRSLAPQAPPRTLPGTTRQQAAPYPEPDLSFLDGLNYDGRLEEDTETFDITGLRYYCTVHDCGRMVGVVKPEPSNLHDNRAQAVIRSDGKLLGYIPRTQLDWYEDFNAENVVCPFVGEMEMERSTSRLIAEIKVILPTSREYVENEIRDSL